MKGQITVEENSQVAQDLEEIDVNLLDPISVQSGWIRVGSALQCTVEQFKKYAKEASDLSSYIKLHLPLDWCYSCNDKERFGSEQLCFVLWLQCIASFMGNGEHWGKYVKPTEKQIERMKAKREKAWKETSQHMCEMLSKIIEDESK